jgi:hypothetical protein
MRDSCSDSDRRTTANASPARSKTAPTPETLFQRVRRRCTQRGDDKVGALTCERPVEGDPHVLGLTRVHTHPDAEAHALGPRRGLERRLRERARPQAVVCGRERAVEAVAGGLDDVAVVLGDRRTDDLVVPGQRVAHGVGMLLPQTRRALDVGEQEGDRPRRQLARTPLPSTSTPTGQSIRD